MSSSDLRYQARQALAGKWGAAILAGFLAALLGGLVTGGASSTLELDENTLAYLPQEFLTILGITLTTGGVLNLVHFILGGPVQLGYSRFLLKMHDGENAETRDLFSQFDRFGDGFCLRLLRGIFIALWTMLFIIPGIVKSYSYSMAHFILLENPGMTATEAITASKSLMDGHKFDLFILDLSFLGWALLSALTLGIGNLWLNPYTNAAHAAFYRSISGCPRCTVE